MGLQSYLNDVWYGERDGHWLRPLSVAYAYVVRRRHDAYHDGRRAIYRAPVPVVIVGNETVGGTGKTPLVIEVVERLKRRGRVPGVISRGYGGSADRAAAVVVDEHSTAAEVGDEPLLIYRRTGAPVAVCPNRELACKTVMSLGADVVVADDGLQHLALHGNLKIEVIDAKRGYGNGRCLPAGPLRVPPDLMCEADLRIENGGAGDNRMHLIGDSARSLNDASQTPLIDFAGQRVHAVAGIGHPARFFDSLRAQGIDVIEHPRNDHASLHHEDLVFGDALPVLMTEKDSVKLAPPFATRLFDVPVSAQLDSAADTALNALLDCLSDNSES